MSDLVQEGQTVSVHYVGTLESGEEFDNSRNREEPITFVVGEGKVISGFEKAVLGMSVGEKKQVKIVSEEAYGDPDPNAVQVVSRDLFPEDSEIKVGMLVQGSSSEFGSFPAVVTAVASNGVIIDMNHPLAGKDLNFDIEVVKIT